MSETTYVIYLVDTDAQAMNLNNVFSTLTTKNFKSQAFAKGHIMHGLRHGGSRPTMIIDAIKVREGQYFMEWYNACVRPTAVRAKVIEAF